MANDAIGRRYALLNKQLQQTEGRQLQQEQDALSRRFAAIGGLGSGASIKADQMASQESSRRLSQGKQALGVAEADERFKQEEIEKGRAFQTSERVGSQDFAAGQAVLQRQFQTGERLGSQDFAAGQAGLQRQFQTGERLGSQEFQTGERLGGQQYASDEAQKQRGFMTSEREAGQKFTAGENALSRRLQEAGLMGFMTDAQGNQIETQAAKDARLGREQQESQFGRQLEQSSQQFTQDLNSRERLAQWDANLKNKIAESEAEFKNANLAWEKYVFSQEFPINKQIAFENLKVQKDAAKNSGLAGDIGSLWNTFTRDPIAKSYDAVSNFFKGI